MHFPEPVLFEIPVFPRTQKFIRTKLTDNLGRPQPLLASTFNQGLGLHIWLIAQSKKIRMVSGWKRSVDWSVLHTDKSGRIIAPPDMTACIGIWIEHFHKTRHQYLLNYSELEQFCSYVDFLIQYEMVCFCQEQPDVQPITRIKEFVSLYDFTEENFKEQSLRMAYWRYRNNPMAHSVNIHLQDVNIYI